MEKVAGIILSIVFLFVFVCEIRAEGQGYREFKIGMPRASVERVFSEKYTGRVFVVPRCDSCPVKVAVGEDGVESVSLYFSENEVLFIVTVSVQYQGESEYQRLIGAMTKKYGKALFVNTDDGGVYAWKLKSCDLQISRRLGDYPYISVSYHGDKNAVQRLQPGDF